MITKLCDATATIGTILDESGQRDAIHVAVISVVACGSLFPGQHVGFLPDGSVGRHAERVGIVDPFLNPTKKIHKGERFWLCIYPRTITSLRHVWSHPEIPEEAAAVRSPVFAKESSEQWLRDFCARSDCPSYDTLIDALRGQWPPEVKDTDDGYFNFQWDGEYLYFGGIDAHSEIPPGFWDHVSVVLGEEVGPEKRAKYFSCSC